MVLENLVQTRIPAEIGQKVEAMATTEGISVAAWLRRLILKEVNSMRTEAWIARIPDNANTNLQPDYYLTRLKDISATEMEFSLLQGPSHQTPGARVSSGWLSDGVDWYRNPEDYRFFLRGSLKPWSIVRMIHNATSDEMLIVLKLQGTEEKVQARPFMKLENLREKLHIDYSSIENAQNAIKANNYLENDFEFSLPELRNIPVQEGFYRISYTVQVTYLPTGRSRTYHETEEGFSAWAFEFSTDLRNRYFDRKVFRFKCAKCSNIWESLDNSGHVFCPTCHNQPEGEPEIWDGKKWTK